MKFKIIFIFLIFSIQSLGSNDQSCRRNDQVPIGLRSLDELKNLRAYVKAQADPRQSAVCRKELPTADEIKIFLDIKEDLPLVELQILYIQKKFNIDADPVDQYATRKWTTEELTPLLQGLEDLPSNIFSQTAPGLKFTRAGFAVLNGGRNANGSHAQHSGVRFYDPLFLLYSEELQTRTAVHELAHAFANPKGYDRSVQWLEAGGWTQQKGIWKTHKPKCFLNEYSATHPDEDFAESFVSYRYTPEVLQKVCPAKYAYLKQFVFKGTEYTSADLCKN